MFSFSLAFVLQLLAKVGWCGDTECGPQNLYLGGERERQKLEKFGKKQ
jgi:hypothetical protein